MKKISFILFLSLMSGVGYSYPIPDKASSCILTFRYEQVFGCVGNDFSQIYVSCNGRFQKVLPNLTSSTDVTDFRKRQAHPEKFEYGGFLEWDSDSYSINEDSGPPTTALPLAGIISTS